MNLNYILTSDHVSVHIECTLTIKHLTLHSLYWLKLWIYPFRVCIWSCILVCPVWRERCHKYLWGVFEIYFAIGSCYCAYWVYFEYWAFDFELPLLTETLNLLFETFHVRLNALVGFDFGLPLLDETLNLFFRDLDVYLLITMLSSVKMWTFDITDFWRLRICINNLRTEFECYLDIG